MKENTSQMKPCGMPWPMLWMTFLEIVRTAIYSKFRNATGKPVAFLRVFQGRLPVTSKIKIVLHMCRTIDFSTPV